MKAGRSRKIGILVGVIVSVAILCALVAGLDWVAFTNALKRLNPAYIPLYIGLFLLSFYLRAIRWRLLLPSHLALSPVKLANATLVGALASSVLPLRAGEFIRPWALSRWQPVSFPMGFASIITERVFDVLAMLTLLGLVLGQLDSAPDLVIIGARALGAVAAGIASVMVIAYVRPATVLRLSDAVYDRLFSARNVGLRDKLSSMTAEFVGGLRAISSVRELFFIVLLSLVIWAEFALVYQVGLWAMGESPSFWVGMTVNVIIALIIAVPSAPGFIGTFQLGCFTALTGIYLYPEEFSLAYSVVNHGLQFVTTIVAGLFVLKREGLRFDDLVRSQELEAR